jgi:MYXO-CTERM domain-containing protein
MMKMTMWTAAAVMTLAGGTWAGTVPATFVAPSGWTRPADLTQAATDQTTYQAWADEFQDNDPGTTGIQDLNPDTASVNPNGAASVSEPGVNGAFLTGGHIYSPNGTVQLTITIPGYGAAAGDKTYFALQIETFGSELVRTDDLSGTPVYEFSAFLIDGVRLDTLADFAYTELNRVVTSFTPPGGEPVRSDIVDHLFTFSVDYSADSFSLYYEPIGESSSQTDLSVDTFTTTVAAPEPASMGLLALGALALIRRR